MLSTLKRDLRFALRQFRRNPGFVATAVLTLALGIGASVAIFSLVDGVLLRPLPFPHPGQLVAINTLVFPPGVAANNLEAAVSDDSSYPDFFDWRRENHTFASLASYQNTPRLFSKMNGEGARVMPAGRISANLFSTLGVSPVLGRNFLPEEEQAGRHTVILSHELWVSDFAASPEVLGQTIKISDTPYVIVGVMPGGFHFPIVEPDALWGTFSVDAEGPKPNIAQRAWGGVSMIGRLKAGVTRQKGLADLNAIQRDLAAQYPEDRDRPGVAVTPLLEDAVSDVRPVLTLLLAAVGLVLLIGCTNVAGLLLARSNARLAEVALRSALGATRAQVIRQLLVESLLLALSGGAAGILLSFALLRAGVTFVPAGMPRAYDIAIDARVLAFAILLSAATALIFGLLPAWRMSRVDPANALREGAASTTGNHRSNRVQQALVVAETALGFILLIGAGLLIRTTMNVLAVEPGFDTKDTVAFDTALTNTRYPHDAKRLFLEKLLPQLAALPGVEKVSAGGPLPFHSPGEANFSIVGHPVAPGRLPSAMNVVVEPGYFETLSIPLVRGRTFAAQDNRPQSSPVAVINQTFARRFFPGEDPIGKYLTTGVAGPLSKTIACQIVGIVGDTRTSDLSDPYHPAFFLPYAQDPDHQRALGGSSRFAGPCP